MLDNFVRDPAEFDIGQDFLSFLNTGNNGGPTTEDNPTVDLTGGVGGGQMDFGNAQTQSQGGYGPKDNPNTDPGQTPNPDNPLSFGAQTQTPPSPEAMMGMGQVGGGPSVSDVVSGGMATPGMPNAPTPAQSAVSAPLKSPSPRSLVRPTQLPALGKGTLTGSAGGLLGGGLGAVGASTQGEENDSLLTLLASLLNQG